MHSRSSARHDGWSRHALVRSYAIRGSREPYQRRCRVMAAPPELVKLGGLSSFCVFNRDLGT
jgi:hypothetical protein